MRNTDLQEIFIRFLQGKASPEEATFLIEQFAKQVDQTQLKAVIRRQLEAGGDIADSVRQAWEPALQDAYKAIRSQIAEKSQVSDANGVEGSRFRSYRFGRWMGGAAAAVILCVAISILFFYQPNTAVSDQATVVQPRDIAPGGNKAILTLGNGAQVILDSVATGVVSTQGNTGIVKLNNGLLAYRKSNERSGEVLFNTVRTPKGGEYQIELSDGTRIWLNAASSVRFPNEFTGSSRHVEITGEAYFEVSNNEKKPFSVSVNGLTVLVLGTHFNVMAYRDEPVSKVTLLEGSLKVREGDHEVLLMPGQQAQAGPDGHLKKVRQVDLQGVMAWKNDQFWFNDDSIETVMRLLSRWYNVKVAIRGHIPQHFGGYISRDIYVSKVFEALKATNYLNYEIQDSTIIVSP